VILKYQLRFLEPWGDVVLRKMMREKQVEEYVSRTSSVSFLCK